MSDLTLAEKRAALPDDVAAIGSGQIELFDAHTHKRQDLVPFENFIGPVGIAYQRWMNRRVFNVPIPGGTSMSDSGAYLTPRASSPISEQTPALDPEPPYPFSALVLTAETAAEDAANERAHWAPLIGYASRHVYAGADTLRGTPNLTEQVFDTTKVKHVFDWATSAANGTIGSVGWAGFENAVYNATMPVGPKLAQKYVRPMTNKNTSMYYAMADGDNLIFTGTTTSRIVPWGDGVSTLDWNAGSNGPTFSGVSNGWAYGLTRIGSEWFVGDYAGNQVRVYDYALTGTLSVKRTFTNSGAAVLTSGSEGSGKGLATDGTNLFTCITETRSGTSRMVVRKINPSTGAVTQEYVVMTHPASFASYSANPALFKYDEVRNELIVAWTTSGTYSAYMVTARVNPTTGVESGRHVSYSYNNNFSNFFDWLGFRKGGKSYSIHYDGGIYETAEESLGTRSKLATPVTKLNTQTMKITYQFSFA